MTIARSNKSGWVFSPQENLLVFWLPIPLIILWWTFLGNDKEILIDIFFIFAVKVPIEMGHVLATAFPLLRRTDDGHLSKINFFLGCFGVFIVSSLILYHSQVLFYIVLTLVGITHICRQQYGWVMLSRKQASEPANERWIDTLMITNVMLVPLIWWQSELGPPQKYYFFPNNIHLLLDATLAQSAINFHWAINIFYIFHMFKKYINRDALNWGKISLIFSTWICFYGSLVILKSRQVFLAELILIHGVAYIIYSYKASKRDPIPTSGKTEFLWSIFIKPWTFMLFCIGLAGLWYLYVYNHEKILFVQPGNMLEVLFWMPLIMHYYFDTFIWRRNIFKSIGPN